MKTVPIGKEDFKKLIESDAYYVDKTKMIEELRENNVEVVLFPRPRRFGKTLTMSMLENFFEITKKDENKDLFKGLYIESSLYYKERGEHPVIFVSFKGLIGKNFSDVYDIFIDMMIKLYNSKKYIYDSLELSEKRYFDAIRNKEGTKAEYMLAVSNLTGYLERYHHKKVIVLIDEYDVPIQDGYLKGYYDEVVDFIRGVFLSALKTNDNVLFSVLTGVLRVSKESLFSGFNNVEVLGIMNSYFGEYFGFTESDTKELLEYYGLELASDVKEMYDGYNFNGVEVYNPWSILNYTKNKTLSPYWVNTSGNVLVKQLLSFAPERNIKVIEDLIQGKSVEFMYDENITYQNFNDYDNYNVLLNLLFMSGYLTLDKKIDNDWTFIKIPNNEVRKILVGMLSEVFIGSRNDLVLSIKNDIENINMDGLEKDLNEILKSKSYMDTTEAFYHGSMLSVFDLCVGNNYIVKSNRETGNGRCDIMLEKKDRSVGYIFEFKVLNDKENIEEKASTALKQIEEKEYYKELILDKVKDIHKVSIVFKGKECIVRSR